MGQPYAFDGPGFLGVRPNAEWFARLRQIARSRAECWITPPVASGPIVPVIFPWVNMGVWAWPAAGIGGLRRMGAGRRPTGARTWSAQLTPPDALVWSTLYNRVLRHPGSKLCATRAGLPLLILLAHTLAQLLRPRARVHGNADPAPPFAARGPDHADPRGQWQAWATRAVVAAVVAGTAAWGTGFTGIYLRPHTRVAGSRWIYANVPHGSVLANEHWDWGLPLRVDGRDGFRDAYTQVTLELYNEDTPDKLAQLLDQLDETDYLIMASNRLYGSIPRLPERYPLTTAYYRALFAGELGFELAGQFTSYIQLGPFVFPDQENPYPLMAPVDTSTQGRLWALRLQPAEESFSVYDHPTCLIFRKTPTTAARAESVLGAVDLSQGSRGSHRMKPHRKRSRALTPRLCGRAAARCPGLGQGRAAPAAAAKSAVKQPHVEVAAMDTNAIDLKQEQRRHPGPRTLSLLRLGPSSHGMIPRRPQPTLARPSYWNCSPASLPRLRRLPTPPAHATLSRPRCGRPRQ